MSRAVAQLLKRIRDIERDVAGLRNRQHAHVRRGYAEMALAGLIEAGDTVPDALTPVSGNRQTVDSSLATLIEIADESGAIKLKPIENASAANRAKATYWNVAANQPLTWSADGQPTVLARLRDGRWLRLPGCCGCTNCDSLFALNWKLRFCGKGITGLPTSDQADNDAFIAAVNAAWNNVAITWVDDSFSLGGFSYQAKLFQISDGTGTTFTVHAFDPSTSAVETFTVSDAKLTVGAAWTTTSPCQLKWFWQVSAAISGGTAQFLIAAGRSAGAGNFVASALTTGGNVRPSMLLPSLAGNCGAADSLFAAQDGLQLGIGVFDITGPIFSSGFDPLSQLHLVSGAGTPTLPSC